MKLFLPLLVLVSAASAAPGFEPRETNYHEKVGIPEAARIKASEEGIDFDGARIVGGSPATLGQFPYMGGLLITLRSGAISVCGSSLLSNTKLVTAAHCWTDGHNTAHELTVVLGSIRLFTGGTRMVTDRIELHENYDPSTLQNDIGLITIYRVPFTTSINRIGIPTGSSTFVGQTAQAVGYGITYEGGTIAFGQGLNHVSVPVISNAECARTFGQISESILCTSGAGGRSTCNGDSGGPLRIGDKLIGISSFFSTNGCQRGLPAGFVRVTSYANWIRPRIL